MKFLIVIPAHNEEDNIFFCLKSLQAQSFRDFRAIVVNDGSTDKTADICQTFCDHDARFSFVSLEKSEHAPGAKIVHSFLKGIENQIIEDYDVICKFDADIIFPSNYLAAIAKKYAENPAAGMVSGLVKIKKSVFERQLAFDFKDEKHQWQFEDISSKEHVRGPIKSYTTECYKAIGGLRPVLGWDNIDVMLAKMYGFEVITVKNLWVKHLRPTAYKYRDQKAKKLGEYFYNIGLSFPLAIISAAKSAAKNRSAREFFIILNSFSKQNGIRKLNAEEIKYIRKLRWQQAFSKLNPLKD